MASLEIKITPLFAGSNWEITENLSDYPATTYDAKYILKKGTASAVEITPTKSGDKFVFSQSDIQTAALTSGNYNVQLVIYALGGSVPIKVYEITKEIKTLLTSSTDTRSFSERMLDAIQSTSEGRATREQAEMQVPGGVNVKHLTPEEMMKWESFYSLRVKAELRNKNGQSNTIQHKVRF